MNGITPIAIIDTAESQKNSSVRENISALRYPIEQLYLFGENSKTQADKSESTVRSLGMSQKSSRLTLSERLTPSLISHGLVRGTTLMFGQRLLKAGIRAGVSFAPDGTVVDIQKGNY